MATGAFQLLEEHEAKLFACAIPRGTRRPPTFEAVEYLRKDHVFLFERLFYFLEQHKQHGLLVLDESDETEDRRFISRCQRYFEKTQAGRHRTQWIVPTPFFVSSALTYPIQIADLCIYCVNRGFRTGNMNAVAHDVIGPEFGPLIERLQFHGDGHKDGSVFKCFGIVFVPDPYVGK